ncbi:MAG: hypothetical protein ACRD0Z_08615 [Acidimicrobiales bacterium]
MGDPAESQSASGALASEQAYLDRSYQLLAEMQARTGAAVDDAAAGAPGPLCFGRIDTEHGAPWCSGRTVSSWRTSPRSCPRWEKWPGVIERAFEAGLQAPREALAASTRWGSVRVEAGTVTELLEQSVASGGPFAERRLRFRRAVAREAMGWLARHRFDLKATSGKCKQSWARTGPSRQRSARCGRPKVRLASCAASTAARHCWGQPPLHG